MQIYATEKQQFWVTVVFITLHGIGRKLSVYRTDTEWRFPCGTPT